MGHVLWGWNLSRWCERTSAEAVVGEDLAEFGFLQKFYIIQCKCETQIGTHCQPTGM